METGGLTWGGYDYVLAVKEEVPSRNGALKLADASFWTKMRPADVSALQGDASANGQDANHWQLHGGGADKDDHR
jgi:hypothetical protein